MYAVVCVPLVDSVTRNANVIRNASKSTALNDCFDLTKLCDELVGIDLVREIKIKTIAVEKKRHLKWYHNSQREIREEQKIKKNGE